MRIREVVVGAALAVAATGGLGCILAADLVNTNVLAALGFDPNSVRQPTGNVIVTFTNNTDTVAVFQFYQADDPNDLSLGVRTAAVAVDPGGTATATNEVVSCPTGAVSLGIVTPGTFQVNDTGALVNNTAVPYAAGALVEGRDYRCGDLVSFSISPAGGQQQAAFVISAQVIPGR